MTIRLRIPDESGRTAFLGVTCLNLKNQKATDHKGSVALNFFTKNRRVCVGIQPTTTCRRETVLNNQTVDLF